MTTRNKFLSLFSRKTVVDVTTEIQYTTKSIVTMSDEELAECEELFNSFYGKYSKESSRRPGQQIKMPPAYYRKNYGKPNFYVAIARLNEKLVGQAFYLRKDYSAQGYGVMTWVLQLVVDPQYRRNGIASTLLRSIWGFSDDYAWGLATTNPCTIKTLESATFRKCKPEKMLKNLRAIKTIGADISFVDENAFFVNRNNSQINSDFYVDNREFLVDNSYEKKLGKLRPGHEWIAFTFRNQGIIQETYQKQFSGMVAFSEAKLKEAYGRMNLETHSWAKGTDNEVDFILQYGENDKILDLGCGQGRHAIALAQKGCSVVAIDFSQRNIEEAREKVLSENGNKSTCSFLCDDIRTYHDSTEYDKVICLYDVIGSFPDEEENIKIIRTAYWQLKKTGVFVLSVMNMDLTNKRAFDYNKGDLHHNPDILRKLPPSRTMQLSGDIFDPHYFAIDTKTNLVYRKEQFDKDDALSAEYIIRDKRYTMDEITQLLKSEGFTIIDARYVRAGHFDEKLKGTDTHAKEICIVAKK